MLVGGGANGIGDGGCIDMLRCKALRQSWSVGTSISKLLERSGSALELSSQNLGGVLIDAIDALNDGNISLTFLQLDSFFGRIEYYGHTCKLLFGILHVARKTTSDLPPSGSLSSNNDSRHPRAMD